MTDSQQINELFHNLQLEDQFKDQQLQFITQTSGNGVVAGQRSIKFSFQNVPEQWSSLARAFIHIPITINAVTALQANPFLAVKQSLLSLIGGVRVRTLGNNKTVINEDNIELSSNLQLLIDNDKEFLSNIAGQLHFAKDYPHPDIDVPALNTTADISDPKTRYFSAAVTAAGPSLIDPTQDAGFIQRRKMLLSDADTIATTGIAFWAKIPLAYIHSFFRQLTFPIYALNLEIEFLFNVNTSGLTYKPFCRGSTSVAAPALEAGDFTVALTTGSEPRLYYHRIEMKTNDAVRAVAMVDKHFIKTLKFTETFVRRYKVAAGNIERDVLTDVKNPKRVWLIAQGSVSAGSAAGALADGVSWPSPLVTGDEYLLEAVNCKLRGIKYLEEDLQTLEQQWEALREQFPKLNGPDAGPLTFQEFKQRYRLVCIDVSRPRNYTDLATASSTLRIMGTVSLECDLTVIVECEREAIATFDARGINNVQV